MTTLVTASTMIHFGAKVTSVSLTGNIVVIVTNMANDFLVMTVAFITTALSSYANANGPYDCYTLLG